MFNGQELDRLFVDWLGLCFIPILSIFLVFARNSGNAEFFRISAFSKFVSFYVVEFHVFFVTQKNGVSRNLKSAKTLNGRIFGPKLVPQKVNTQGFSPGWKVYKRFPQGGRTFVQRAFVQGCHFIAAGQLNMPI